MPRTVNDVQRNIRIIVISQEAEAQGRRQVQVLFDYRERVPCLG